jgi:large conductance mechanosensitive channel
MLKEFREFAMRGNVVDMAIGILIGGAFAPIAQSLVNDVFMPPIGLALGGADFNDLFAVLKPGTPPGPYASLETATAAGAVTINYGRFGNSILTFLVVAFAAFLIVKAINRMRRRQEGVAGDQPTTKKCPQCLSDVAIKATRCAFCTGDLPAAA